MCPACAYSAYLPNWRAFLTSPRSLRGEVEIRDSEFRVRGKARRLLQFSFLTEQRPLTPTLSPQERGEGEEITSPSRGRRQKNQSGRVISNMASGLISK